MAEAPVPTTQTLLLRRSKPCSHRAEWKTLPRNWSKPGKSGMPGSLSDPVAQTRWGALNSAPAARTVQVLVASSQRASETGCP